VLKSPDGPAGGGGHRGHFSSDLVREIPTGCKKRLPAADKQRMRRESCLGRKAKEAGAANKPSTRWQNVFLNNAS
jgi:hypothetical protein